MSIKLLVNKIVRKVYFWIHERNWKGRLKYMYLRNHSNRLIVIFSGFPAGEKPLYNYMRTLNDVKVDKLFILDDFGYKGSYYLLENGTERPRDLVQSLIEHVVRENGGRYSSLIMAGSSKGGTAAIYYGLQCNANVVYSGACQYYIGDYLNRPQFAPIVKGMTGKEPSDEVISNLNKIMPEHLRKHEGATTIIHLLYSKGEHTYQEHIVDLINDLKKYSIPYVEIIEEFSDHNQVGRFFSPFLKQELT